MEPERGSSCILEFILRRGVRRCPRNATAPAPRRRGEGDGGHGQLSARAEVPQRRTSPTTSSVTPHNSTGRVMLRWPHRPRPESADGAPRRRRGC